MFKIITIKSGVLRYRRWRQGGRLREPLRLARKAAADWNSAAFISEDDRQRHRLRFIKAKGGLYKFEQSREIFASIWGKFILSIIIANPLIIEYYSDNVAFTDIYQVYTKYIMMTMLIIIFQFVVFFISGKLIYKAVSLFWLTPREALVISIYGTLIISIMASAIYLIIPEHILLEKFAGWYLLLRSGCLILLTSSIGLVVTLALFSQVVSALRMRSWARYPLSHIVERLFRVTLQLQHAGPRWDSPDFRASMISELELAALISRRFLLQRFKSTDKATQAWQKHQSLRISAALAEKTTWIMTPKADTRAVLIDALSVTLVILVSGNWDELTLHLAAEPLENDEGRKGWRRAAMAVFSAARTLTAAAIPGVLFWSATKLSLMNEMSNETKDLVEVETFALSAVILMLMIDPSIKEKIATLKDATSILPFGRKKN